MNLIRSKKIQKSLRLQVYHPRVKIATKPLGHQYHLRSKGPAPIPAPRVSRVKSLEVKLDQTIVATELLECSRL